MIRTHLRGVFAPTRHAAACWRERAKAGQADDARVICTSSPRGLERVSPLVVWLGSEQSREIVPGLVAKAAPNCDMWGQPIVAG